MIQLNRTIRPIKETMSIKAIGINASARPPRIRRAGAPLAIAAGLVLALATGLALATASTARAQASAPAGNGLSANGIGASSAAAPSSGLDGVGGVAAGGVPNAQVAEPNYDFGTASSGTTVAHVFKIRNSGTGTLIIGGVQTSCGCTAATPSKSTLAPGEESAIAVSFDTRFDKGAATRTITVFTNDLKAQKILMTLKGVIKVEVDASPEQIAFGEVKRGAVQSRQVLINDLMAGGDFKVTGVANASPAIRAAIVPRTDGKPGAALNVTLLGTMPVGEFDDTIKVMTSLAPVDVTVFGTVTGDLTVKPGEVSFGIVPHRQGVMRIARMVNAGDRAVNVLGITSTNQSVSAAVEPVRPGHEYKITIELRPDTPEGTVRGRLAIRTDDPEQQTVEIPFSGIVGSFKG